MSKPATLASKIRKYLRKKESASLEYKAVDKLYEEIVPLMEAKGKPVKIHRRQAAQLKDNFAEKFKAFRAHGISRYDIEVIDA